MKLRNCFYILINEVFMNLIIVFLLITPHSKMMNLIVACFKNWMYYLIFQSFRCSFFTSKQTHTIFKASSYHSVYTIIWRICQKNNFKFLITSSSGDNRKCRCTLSNYVFFNLYLKGKLSPLHLYILVCSLLLSELVLSSFSASELTLLSYH